MKAKIVNYNGATIGSAATWSQVGMLLRERHPADDKIKRMADSLSVGILGEISWRAVETPVAFTIASAFGTSGLALAMMVGAP